jgi:REP element-mobilizing transposase RayT
VDDPLAYFLTFRTYGTWLPGDIRGYVAAGATHESPLLAPNPDWVERIGGSMRDAPFRMTQPQRTSVTETIRRVCGLREWSMLAANIRTNHVHVVVAAATTPELVLNAFKTWCTRQLRDDGLAPANGRVWARHGSTRYLWQESAVEAAVWYVVHGQNKPGVPRYNEWDPARPPLP